MTTAHEKDYAGCLFIGDPHVAASPPGHRLDDYRETVLEKLAFCLDLARDRRLLPIVLGDLFHVPRDNPNELLVDLMDLFRPVKPWVLVGNHDKYQARYTRDVSLAVLEAAGVVRLLSEAGPAASLAMAGRQVLLGAAPDWTPLPKRVDRQGHDFVIWVAHHNLQFPDYEAGRIALTEIPGVDLVVNGHIHTPKPPQQRGATLWLNPGSLTRISRSPVTRSVRPGVTIWWAGSGQLERVEVPARPFEEVFPPLDESGFSGDGEMDASRFIRGLENLALRKTTEGVGLKAFLEANLDSHDPVDRIIWDLYQEVMHHDRKE
ncbi:Calcineurin-like phosphoesterase [Desulfacinum hydrothermale DSM 13146]|uniref:Calcineurin-like phosphoesterase n=1 Tax=Desulfacinum hydrothermale DSM 13146 TaxID=1121390 RepID=A0A1W1XDB2_9BACT|nr:metallophosphoesterase [Desulfacinum hydrothermale]SMC21879.1 Calcineurin-like phosphoesterase [Desulfacinum hydrothermale DSM 13146]